MVIVMGMMAMKVKVVVMVMVILVCNGRSIQNGIILYAPYDEYKAFSS